MRKELARHQADRDNIAYELKAVNHHRTVLRDATEQLERAVKNQADTIADLEFQVEQLQGRTGSRSGAAATVAGSDTPGDWANTSVEGAAGAQRDSSGEEALLRQVNRYKARAAAMEELSVTYRVSVLALYRTDLPTVQHSSVGSHTMRPAAATTTVVYTTITTMQATPMVVRNIVVLWSASVSAGLSAR